MSITGYHDHVTGTRDANVVAPRTRTMRRRSIRSFDLRERCRAHDHAQKNRSGFNRLRVCVKFMVFYSCYMHRTTASVRRPTGVCACTPHNRIARVLLCCCSTTLLRCPLLRSNASTLIRQNGKRDTHQAPLPELPLAVDAKSVLKRFIGGNNGQPRYAAANFRCSGCRAWAAHATDGAGERHKNRNESRLSEPWFGQLRSSRD
jgi:hypothetical protein